MFRARLTIAVTSILLSSATVGPLWAQDLTAQYQGQYQGQNPAAPPLDTAQATAAPVTENAAFVQALAAALGDDADALAFYTTRGFAPLWTGAGDADRRAALFAAFGNAPAHGLPAARYDATVLAEDLRRAATEGDRGRAEAAITRAYLDYARDVHAGVVRNPAKLDKWMQRKGTPIETGVLLSRIDSEDAASVLASLPPQMPEYAALMREKAVLESLLGKEAWGAQVPPGKLVPGDQGRAVAALRDRLAHLGYMAPGMGDVYDADLEAGVKEFQADHGLNDDGVAGVGTISEINMQPEDRLKSVVVAMERLRWMEDVTREGRYIWVNEPDFTAKIVDDGRVTFRTRAVVGLNGTDTRSPEFSDEMEFMVINPSWGVPRSIIVKEYLPMLQKDPNSVAQLNVVDGSGRVVPRDSVDFAAYTPETFPFGMRQPPSDGNALGKVKFMFPNKNNIYLHDTPQKSLFAKQVRAFSHGCIRLADPFDFAYALLAVQTDDPKGVFAAHLANKTENTIPLDRHVPVHLVYFTAFPDIDTGRMAWRADVYGRDAAIFAELADAGVVLGGVQG